MVTYCKLSRRSPDDTNLFFVHDISYPLAQSLSLEKQLQKQELQAANSLNDIPQHQQTHSTQENSPQSPSVPPPAVRNHFYFIYIYIVWSIKLCTH